MSRTHKDTKFAQKTRFSYRCKSARRKILANIKNTFRRKSRTTFKSEMNSRALKYGATDSWYFD